MDGYGALPAADAKADAGPAAGAGGGAQAGKAGAQARPGACQKTDQYLEPEFAQNEGLPFRKNGRERPCELNDSRPGLTGTKGKSGRKGPSVPQEHPRGPKARSAEKRRSLPAFEKNGRAMGHPKYIKTARRVGYKIEK